MLCKLVEVLVENTLILGEDSIGSAFSANQAHIMSGRVYFMELCKTIQHLVPDTNPLDEEEDNDESEEDTSTHERVIALLRKVASKLLEHANGDGSSWTFETMEELSDCNSQLNTAFRDLFAEDSADMLIFVAQCIVMQCSLVLLHEGDLRGYLRSESELSG